MQISTQPNPFLSTTVIDYVSGTNPIYVGEAATGSALTAAVWRIKKITYDGNGNPTNVQYAGTGASDQIWNNRASLIYT